MAQGTIRVNLAALAANLQRMRAAASGAQVAAVVKADAYGLGLSGVLPTLTCDSYFVARLEEGIALRARVYDQPALTCMFGDQAAVVLGANVAQLRQALQGQAGEAEPVLPERQRAGGERIIQALEALLDERLRMFDQLRAISAGKQAEGLLAQLARDGRQIGLQRVAHLGEQAAAA